jgi:hypothetical protein
MCLSVTRAATRTADIDGGHGDGGQSIYGPTFPDESFAIKHSTSGVLVRGCQRCLLFRVVQRLRGVGVHVRCVPSCGVAGHGEHRCAAHEQLTVLRLTMPDAVDGRQARCVRACRSRHASTSVRDALDVIRGLVCAAVLSGGLVCAALVVGVQAH